MNRLVFVSHSGDDAWVAQKLGDCLSAVGANVFLDDLHIAIGESFEERILSALHDADEIIVLATPWALKRPYVWLELGAAWFRRIPVIVLLYGITAAEFRATAAIPIALQEKNLIALNDSQKYFRELSTRIGESDGIRA